MFKKIFLSLLFFIFSFTGVASAHGGEQQARTLPENFIENTSNIAGMLPNSPFYFLEILSEDIGSFFTFNEIKKSERALNLAEERLAEAEELAVLGSSDYIPKTMDKYEKQLEKALKKAEKAKKKGENTDEVFTKIAESTVKHQTKLAEVYKQVPEKTKETTLRAMEQSMKLYDEAVNSFSKEKQDALLSDLDQLFEKVDGSLEELRIEGIDLPKIKDRKHEVNDDLEEDADEVEDSDENFDDNLDDLEDDLKDLDNLDDELNDDLKDLI